MTQIAPGARRARSPLAPGLAPIVSLALAVVVAGCAAAEAPASFDPAADCTIDQRLPGAYPALEALVPATLFGERPDSLDSGRNCTEKNLGTLASYGIEEVRFAGGLWERSTTSGITLAVFTGDGLTAERLGEWYEATARTARRTAGIRPSRPTIDGRQAYRLDLLVDERPQAVITWPSADGSHVQVVIGAGVPATEIDAAIATFP